ncbi:MAG: transposase [Myxococcales bacterium]|nr:transposase [Myxococcales bacterium]
MLAHRALATVTRRALPGASSVLSPGSPVERPQSLVCGDTGYGARGPVAESRLRRLEDGRYEYTPKKDVAFVVTAEQLVRRLVSLVPPAKTHLTSFHGVYAPHAALRPLVTAPPPKPAPAAPASSSKKRRRPSRRLLGQPPPAHLVSLPTTSPPGALSGADVLRCPCGGRRRIIAIHSTRKAAEERLTQLGHHLPPRRLLPPATAQPTLPLAG